MGEGRGKAQACHVLHCSTVILPLSPLGLEVARTKEPISVLGRSKTDVTPNHWVCT